MPNYKKKTADFIITGLFALIIMVMLFIFCPISANAETGTLGNEKPYVYFSYEKDGVAVDGNKLTAGEYDVKIHLTGMKSCSVFQLSAKYDTSVVTPAKEVTSLISDGTDSGFESMGYVLANGEIVFGLVSTRDDCTAIENDTVFAAFKATFSQDCDAADYITITAEPRYTFVQADYGDGFGDEYTPATATDFPDYQGKLYAMQCDVTPQFGHDVSGSIVVMTSPRGDTVNTAAYGEYDVKIYTDAERTNELTDKAVTSVTSVDASGKRTNTFTIKGLVPGTYYASVSYDYALTRNDITIVVADNDITDAVIPVVACDYNRDNIVNIVDVREVKVATSVENAPMYYDLTGDNIVNIVDLRIVKLCASSAPDYPPIVIK